MSLECYYSQLCNSLTGVVGGSLENQWVAFKKIGTQDGYLEQI